MVVYHIVLVLAGTTSVRNAKRILVIFLPAEKVHQLCNIYFIVPMSIKCKNLTQCHHNDFLLTFVRVVLYLCCFVGLVSYVIALLKMIVQIYLVESRL